MTVTTAPPTAEAVARRDAMRAVIERMNGDAEHLATMAAEVYARQDWHEFGHPNWATYVAQELPAPRLDRQQRREVVALLTGEGMSTREVAPVVGAHFTTVAGDVRAASAVGIPTADAEPEPAEPAPVVTPSGITVPEGGDPSQYENSCFVDPTGGVRDLEELFRSTDPFLRNAYANPSKPQLDAIEAWLAKHQRRLTRARKAL